MHSFINRVVEMLKMSDSINLPVPNEVDLEAKHPLYNT
jgi:hypothetical protein